MSTLNARLVALQEEVQRRKGRLEQIEDDIASVSASIKSDKLTLRNHQEALEIIKDVGLQTQKRLQHNISDVTTLAMHVVFPDPYDLLVKFVERSNKTECDLFFSRGNKKIDPMTASGGGEVDIGAFALRVASIAMARPHLRPTIVLDEPFKHLSTNLHARAGEMLIKMSSNPKFKLQIIMVTHSGALAECADVRCELGVKKGISYIK